MKKEEKELLLKDLCARLPYGVKVQVPEQISINPLRVYGVRQMYKSIWGVGRSKWMATFWNDTFANIKEVKPYLRPMSTMTEEEKKELLQISNFNPDIDDICYDSICLIERTLIDIIDIANFISWLNAHHFDYRGLIEKELAIEAPEGMYKND